MDLQHVRYFVAVFDHGSVHAAASAVGVAQPTISQALRSLEREFKVPLFYRIGRGMVPTSAGYAFVGPARRMLRDIVTASGAVPDAEGNLRGRVDIRAHPAVSTGLLPTIVAEYHRRHPMVRVTIATMYDETDATTLLRNAGCEIVVAHLPLAHGEAETADRAAAGAGGFQTLELGVQEYVLALPPEPGSPPLAGLPWEDLDEPMVVVPQPAVHADRIFTALSPRQQVRRPAVVLESREARLAFARAGVAPVWLERSMTDLALDQGVRVRTIEPPLPGPFGLVFDAESLSPAAAAFVRVAAQVADTPGTPDATSRNAAAPGDT
ncbi:MAG TPA: LysR family transcriptional regulator [Trebonia sp.]|jgi:DNA-binding transcriptional LysR family regulator